MKLSTVSIVLSLGAAAAEQPRVFGRGRSMRKRSYAPKRIFTPKTSKKSALSGDGGEAAMSFSGLDLLAKASKADGGDLAKSSKASKMSKVAAFSVDASASKGASLANAEVYHWSKTSKRSKTAAERVEALESMSYEFASLSSYEFASLSYDFSVVTDDGVPTTVAPPAATTPQEPTSDAPNWGHVIFEYLGECTGVELPDDSCLASKTIDAFMGMDYDADASGNARFLQVSGETEGDCGPPDVSEEYLRTILDKHRDHCEEGDFEVSDQEFEAIAYTYLRIFSNRDCWESLCSEGDDVSKLFMKILFDHAAECAGVDLDIDECVMDHVIELILDVDTPAPSRVRRVLQQEEDPCDQPSEADLAFFVSFMLIDAQAECSKDGELDQDWNKISSDLVTIFASTECWGIGDCGEEPAVSSADYSLPTWSPSEFESTLVVTDDGVQCILAPNSDPESARLMELIFYYRVEEASGDDTPSLGDIEGALLGIEVALVETICNPEDRRRARRLTDGPQEPDIVVVESAPEDVITDYPCSPEHPNATSCSIVEGKMTLILGGQSTVYDEEIKMQAYEALKDTFADLANTLSDDFVDIVYLGKDPPATAPITPDDSPSTDKLVEEVGDDSASYAAVAAAAAGGLVAMALIITGFHRMNSTSDDEVSAVPDEKPTDLAAHGEEDSAYHTADLTYANSCDRSDVSSLPSPARSMDGALSPYSHRGSPNKFAFVVAEEEEENWRELSILPALAQDDGTLEGVSEEGEFISSVYSTSSGEISV